MIRPLDYETELTLEQAQERFQEILDAFEKIKKGYPGFPGRLRRKISDEDNKTLGDCIGVLLPLSMKAAVQQQLVSGEEYPLWMQIGRLQQDIMLFLARFKNSGVKVIQGGGDFFGF